MKPVAVAALAAALGCLAAGPTPGFSFVDSKGTMRGSVVLRPFEPALYFKSHLLFRPGTQPPVLERAFVAALLRARTRSDAL